MLKLIVKRSQSYFMSMIETRKECVSVCLCICVRVSMFVCVWVLNFVYIEDRVCRPSYPLFNSSIFAIILITNRCFCILLSTHWNLCRFEFLMLSVSRSLYPFLLLISTVMILARNYNVKFLQNYLLDLQFLKLKNLLVLITSSSKLNLLEISLQYGHAKDQIYFLS